jgi:hypothetical protein
MDEHAVLGNDIDPKIGLIHRWGEPMAWVWHGPGCSIHALTVDKYRGS